MSLIEDKQTIRESIENWAIWRDSGDWERLRTAWHEDGAMMTTWFQGPADAFISASRAAWTKGVNVIHLLGGTYIDIEDARAIAQTRMTISQRAELNGIACDCVCIGRFYDFFERREGVWGLVLRQPIYEKDRLDPVNPATTLELDRVRLEVLPEGYRHLGYIQSAIGMTVRLNLPSTRGAAVEEPLRSRPTLARRRNAYCRATWLSK